MPRGMTERTRLMTSPKKELLEFLVPSQIPDFFDGPATHTDIQKADGSIHFERMFETISSLVN